MFAYCRLAILGALLSISCAPPALAQERTLEKANVFLDELGKSGRIQSPFWDAAKRKWDVYTNVGGEAKEAPPRRILGVRQVQPCTSEIERSAPTDLDPSGRTTVLIDWARAFRNTTSKPGSSTVSIYTAVPGDLIREVIFIEQEALRQRVADAIDFLLERCDPLVNEAF